MLADEPVASLDPRNAKIVMDALQRINRHFGLTVLCNLHSLDLARTYCDRLVGMAGGRVVFDDGAGRADRRRGPRTLRAGGERGDGAPARGGSQRSLSDRRHRLTTLPVNHTLDRSDHDRSPHPADRTCRRRHRCTATNVRAQSYKQAYPELVFAVVPAENASGVTDRYASRSPPI